MIKPRTIILILVLALGLAACTVRVPTQECLTRKGQVEHVATIADTELSAGLTMGEVRAILKTEPDKIINVSGTDGLVTWKYHMTRECQERLGGPLAPSTELIFLKGRLLKWRSYSE